MPGKCGTAKSERLEKLLIAKNAGLSSLRLVGYLVQQSSNVGIALQSLAHYMHRIVNEAEVDGVDLGRDTLFAGLLFEF